jgi:GTP:adenosylcobinamide-phosphate guanylyltransferase
MTSRSLDAILPAGGRLTGEFAGEAGVTVKALIRIDGRTVLERTIETLRSTGIVNRIVVVGPSELALHPATRGADSVITEGDSGPDNILRGIDWLEAQGSIAERVLVVTTDLPFLTSAAIRAFVEACPASGDICVPILRGEAFNARFPDSPATFAALADGAWTMACGFLLDPLAVRRNYTRIQQVFDARKSEMAMARLLGPLFILRYLTKRLRVEDIERRCTEILNCRGIAVRNAPPELAADIDTIEDYRHAVAHAGAIQNWY